MKMHYAFQHCKDMTHNLAQYSAKNGPFTESWNGFIAW